MDEARLLKNQAGSRLHTTTAQFQENGVLGGWTLPGSDLKVEPKVPWKHPSQNSLVFYCRMFDSCPGSRSLLFWGTILPPVEGEPLWFQGTEQLRNVWGL